MSDSKVSIVVPVYGVEKYIEKCALSIFNQTYRNIEVIFVNDCTKDDSIAVLEDLIAKYSGIVCRIVHHDRNRGLAAARNTGVQSATGDYILHVDSDDWIEPTMVEKLVSKATQTGVDIVICGYNIVRKSGALSSLPKVYQDKNELIKHILFKAVPGSMWGKLISKKIYDEHPDSWSIEGINHGEDYATMPRLLYYANKVAYVEEPLYNYNVANQNSYTHNFSRESMESMIKADKVLYDFFQDKCEGIILDLMKIRTKTNIIKQGNVSLYSDLRNMYASEQNRCFKKLPKRDKLLLKCVGKGLDSVVGLVVRKYLQHR